MIVFGRTGFIIVFAARKKLYGCVVDMADNLVRKTDGGFDEDEYFAHPERYASCFANKVSTIIYLIAMLRQLHAMSFHSITFT